MSNYNATRVYFRANHQPLEHLTPALRLASPEVAARPESHADYWHSTWSVVGVRVDLENEKEEVLLM
jgi:hypothetical protein